MLVKFFKETKIIRETRSKILKRVGEPASVLTKGPRGNMREGHSESSKKRPGD